MLDYIHTDENAVYYECGYSNDNCIYFSLGSESFFLTDSRYTLDAGIKLKQNSPKTQLIIGTDLTKNALKLITDNKVKQIAFDPKEWDYYRITKIQERSKLKWIAKVSLSQKKRIIKKRDEIEILQKAVKLGESAFAKFAMAINDDGIGKTEKQLFFMAQSHMSRFGRNSLSFDPIVALNANAAMPHARPSKNKLREEDLLLFDAGLKHQRYCSDRTRTVRVGEDFTFDCNQKFQSKKLQKAYDAVLKAHDRAIIKARSGMRANQIDAICRQTIEEAGFGKYFIHSTGHGVGLDIHELPVISTRSKTKIKDGMVYTIEPGIYIPDTFGIRIEDMVVMESGKARVL